MTPAELDVLADKVADRLREPMISTALPRHIGELLLEAGKHGSFVHTHWVPLNAALGLQVEWTVYPNGSLALRLFDFNGQRFWQGTFQAP